MNKLIYAESESARRYMSAAEKLLTRERYERFNRLKNEKDRLDCLAAGLLLNELVGDMSLYYKDEKGCPRLKDGRSVSISHSGGICAVAISDSAVGIDIQKNEEKNIFSLARIAFHEKEREFLKSCKNPSDAFYTLWCLKESYMKARGLGFSLAPKSFWFDISGERIILHSDDKEPWRFKSFAIENISAAVCCMGDNDFEPEKISLT